MKTPSGSPAATPLAGAARRRLPKEILDRASLRGNEYAWRIEDIPAVIEAARKAGLVNIGGQLQFRIPDVGTCECWWVDVRTSRSVSENLPWKERVARTADRALADFTQLTSEYDFLREGWEGFGPYLQKVVGEGRDPAEFMCFVWYVEDKQTAAKILISGVKAATHLLGRLAGREWKCSKTG